jgi:hypothetical protein
MKFEDVQKHMIICERALESYLGQKKESLSAEEIKNIGELADRTYAIKLSLFDDKEFKMPPEFPFPKKHVLEQLDFYQIQLRSKLPRMDGPSPP